MTSSSSSPGVAVVQGASRGIGLALTRALVADERYARVVATCRHPHAADDLHALAARADDRLDLLTLDVTDEASIAAAARATGRNPAPVSLLINCAGVLHGEGFGPERRLDDIDPVRLHEVFAVNAFGPLLVAKHFSPLFDRESRGVLANLSARVGSIGDNGLGGWYSYRGSKAAQNMFTANLAIELRRRHRGIICVALHPGTVDTDLSKPFQRRVPEHKLFDVDRAAAQLLAVIDGLEPDANGRFHAWDGAEIPW